jgi:hypothetical protein
MTETMQKEMVRRLKYIIHRGFTEVRNLAGIAGAERQIHDLADAMEILPRYLDSPTDDDLEMIRCVLKDYHDHYPQSRGLLKYLDCDDVPDRY